MSDTESVEGGRTSPVAGGRHEKSLGLLTSKFVDLLKSAEGGVLDLKRAADMLDVRQKRRIYDITNVLEGIGLIEKENKNTIRWKGASQSANSSELLEQLSSLRARRVELEKQESELDEQHKKMEQCLKNIAEDTTNDHLRYVTHDDVCEVEPFGGDTVLVIQAPPGTQLTADQHCRFRTPKTRMPSSDQPKKSGRYRMHLKSTSGPINVLVLNQEEDVTTSVLVPTPKCPRTSGEHTHARQRHEEGKREEDMCMDVDSPGVAGREHPPGSARLGDEVAGEEPIAAGRRGRDEPQKTGEDQQQPKDVSPGAIEATGRRLRSGRVTQPSPKKDGSARDAPRQDVTPVEGEKTDSDGTTPQGPQSSPRSLAAVVKRLHKDRIQEQGLKGAVSVGSQSGEYCLSSAPVPVLKLSPAPGEKDYLFHLDEREGLSDLYDLKKQPRVSSSS